MTVRGVGALRYPSIGNLQRKVYLLEKDFFFLLEDLLLSRSYRLEIEERRTG